MQKIANVEIPFVNTQELVVNRLDELNIISSIDLQLSVMQANYMLSLNEQKIVEDGRTYKLGIEERFINVSEYITVGDRAALDSNQYMVEVQYQLVNILNTCFEHIVDMHNGFASVQKNGGYVNSYMYDQLVDMFESLTNKTVRKLIYIEWQQVKYLPELKNSDAKIIQRMKKNQPPLKSLLHYNRMNNLISIYSELIDIYELILKNQQQTYEWLKKAKRGFYVKPEFKLGLRYQLTKLNETAQDLSNISQLASSTAQQNERWKYISDIVKVQAINPTQAKEQIADRSILRLDQQNNQLIGVRNQYISSLKYTQAISQEQSGVNVTQDIKDKQNGFTSGKLNDLVTYINKIQAQQTTEHVWQKNNLHSTWQISVVDGLSDQLSSFYGVGTRPFQNFHFISSRDIIENTLMVNYETPDTLLLYTPQLLQSWGIVGDIISSFDIFGDRTASPSGQKRMVNLEIQLNPLIDESKRHTVVKEKSIGKIPQIRAIVGTQMLKREMQSQMYMGSIVMIGKPDIKPYDYQYIEDSKAGIFGLFQIRSVSQQFGIEVGYVTEITLMPIIHTRDLHMTFMYKVLINTLIGQLFVVTTFYTLGQSGQLYSSAVKTAGKATAKSVTKQIGKQQINKYAFGLGAAYQTKSIVDSLNVGKYINYSSARVFTNEQDQVIQEDRLYFPFDVVPPMKDGKPFLTNQQLYVPTGLYDVFEQQWQATAQWWNEAGTQFTQFFTRDIENSLYFAFSMMKWND